jgi:hypothetical protein
MPKECAFCPRPADSGEHIWSDWLCRLPPFRNVKVTVRRHLVVEPHVRTWHQTGMGHKEYTVCNKCNTTWMSQIEDNHAKPCIERMVLSKAPLALHVSCLASIAIFTFLKSVVSEHMQRSKPFFSMETRRRFRRTLTLPAIQVWLGCLDTFEPEYAVNRMKYSFAVSKISHNYRLYAYTWSFGHLVIQMLASKSRSTHFRKTFLFLDQPSMAAYLLPIWPPPPQSIAWPPSHHLSHALVDKLTNRFRV